MVRFNWDRVRDTATYELRDGEVLRAVFPALTPRDDHGRGFLPATLIPLVIAFERWRWIRASRRTTKESLFPVAPRMLLGLTDRRLLVWVAGRRWSMGRFIGFVTLDRVVQAEAVTVGGGWRTLRVDLAVEPSVRIRVPGRSADDGGGSIWARARRCRRVTADRQIAVSKVPLPAMLLAGRDCRAVGLFSRAKPVTASVGDKPIRCLVCGGDEFWDREIKLNTTGMEVFDMAWANKSALGLVCAACGYVHEFVGDAVQMWETK